MPISTFYWWLLQVLVSPKRSSGLENSGEPPKTSTWRQILSRARLFLMCLLVVLSSLFYLQGNFNSFTVLTWLLVSLVSCALLMTLSFLILSTIYLTTHLISQKKDAIERESRSISKSQS